MRSFRIRNIKCNHRISSIKHCSDKAVMKVIDKVAGGYIVTCNLAFIRTDAESVLIEKNCNHSGLFNSGFSDSDFILRVRSNPYF